MVTAFRMKAKELMRPGNARILCSVSSSIVAVYFAITVSPLPVQLLYRNRHFALLQAEILDCAIRLLMCISAIPLKPLIARCKLSSRSNIIV